MGFITSALWWLLVKAPHSIIEPLHNKRRCKNQNKGVRCCQNGLLSNIHFRKVQRQTHTLWWESSVMETPPRCGGQIHQGQTNASRCRWRSVSTDQTSNPSYDSNQLFCNGTLACKAIPRHDSLTREYNRENMVPLHLPPPWWDLRGLQVSALSQVWSHPSVSTGDREMSTVKKVRSTLNSNTPQMSSSSSSSPSGCSFCCTLFPPLHE